MVRALDLCFALFGLIVLSPTANHRFVRWLVG